MQGVLLTGLLRVKTSRTRKSSEDEIAECDVPSTRPSVDWEHQDGPIKQLAHMIIVDYSAISSGFTDVVDWEHKDTVIQCAVIQCSLEIVHFSEIIISFNVVKT